MLQSPWTTHPLSCHPAHNLVVVFAEPHSQAPITSHPGSCNLPLLAARVFSLPVVLAVPSLSLQASPGFPSFWILAPFSAFKPSRSLSCLAHSFTAESLSPPHHGHLFSTCYVLDRSTFTLSSSFLGESRNHTDLTPTSAPSTVRFVGVLQKFLSPRCPLASSASLLSLVCLSPCVISHLALRLEALGGKETYLHPASAGSPAQWGSWAQGCQQHSTGSYQQS